MSGVGVFIYLCVAPENLVLVARRKSCPTFEPLRLLPMRIILLHVLFQSNIVELDADGVPGVVEGEGAIDLDCPVSGVHFGPESDGLLAGVGKGSEAVPLGELLL
jgi:hypothetical protein